MLYRYIHSMKRQTYGKCVLAKDWNIKVLSFLNICHLYDPGCSIQTCYELPLKYTRVTSLVLYINRISMSFCLFVCPQTTPREMDRYSWMIHRWMRAFPGTKVVYSGTRYDYLVRKYTKKTNFGPPKYFDFFRCTKCRNFFL